MTLVFEGVEWGRQVVSLKEEKMEEKREGCCRQRERGAEVWKFFEKNAIKQVFYTPYLLHLHP